MNEALIEWYCDSTVLLKALRFEEVLSKLISISLVLFGMSLVIWNIIDWIAKILQQ
jgi:hypothetical protein